MTYQCKFKSREEAKNVIFEYIEVFYNHARIHSANDYLSPAEFEALTETKVLQKTAWLFVRKTVNTSKLGGNKF